VEPVAQEESSELEEKVRADASVQAGLGQDLAHCFSERWFPRLPVGTVVSSSKGGVFCLQSALRGELAPVIRRAAVPGWSLPTPVHSVHLALFL
jgi:hypothetical protein